MGKCGYYMDKTLTWIGQNKMITFLVLLSFSLFVSTVALAATNGRLRGYIEEANRHTSVATTTPIPETTSIPETTEIPETTPIPDTTGTSDEIAETTSEDTGSQDPISRRKRSLVEERAQIKHAFRWIRFSQQ